MAAVGVDEQVGAGEAPSHLARFGDRGDVVELAGQDQRRDSCREALQPAGTGASVPPRGGGGQRRQLIRWASSEVRYSRRLKGAK